MQQNNPIYRNARERKYWRLGIPFYTWETNLEGLPFKACTNLGEKTPPRAQRAALKHVVAEPRYQLICISSLATDRCAVAAACWVLMELADIGMNVMLLNAGLEDVKVKERIGAVAIHNIMSDATPARRERVRDLYWRYQCPRILVINGTMDPDSYCRDKLGLYPTFCCRVDDT